MTVASAMQSAALRLMGRRPSVFFASDEQFEAELCDLVNEAAQDIAKYADWQALMRVATITGDGTTEAFDVPADYDRMPVTGGVQDSGSWLFGYFGYGDINSFLFAQARGFQPNPGGWIIYGDQMRFAPAPTSSATFPYITKNWARPSSGPDKPAFTDDADTFLLPERLLTLWLVWRWRENKKLDASGDQESFVKALDEYAVRDRGTRSYSRSSRRAIPGTHLAWPWALGGA